MAEQSRQGNNRKRQNPSNLMLAKDEHDDRSLWRHKVTDTKGIGRQIFGREDLLLL